MKRTLLTILALGALTAPALAQTIPAPPPPAPLVPSKHGPELPVPAKRPPPPAVSPIPYVYRQIDRARVNTNTTIGRTNAVGGAVQDQRTGWNAPGLSGNAM